MGNAARSTRSRSPPFSPSRFCSCCSRSRAVTASGAAVGVTFTVVIGLVADLDSPREGFLKVSQQALVDLRESMKTGPPP